METNYNDHIANQKEHRQDVKRDQTAPISPNEAKWGQIRKPSCHTFTSPDLSSSFFLEYHLHVLQYRY